MTARVDTFGLEFYGCRASLDDADLLEEALLAGAAAVGATVVNTARAIYQPHGVTVCLLLAESHIIIATWPEHGYANINLMLCNNDMDPKQVGAAIAERLQPAQTRTWATAQHIGPTPPAE